MNSDRRMITNMNNHLINNHNNTAITIDIDIDIDSTINSNSNNNDITIDIDTTINRNSNITNEVTIHIRNRTMNSDCRIITKNSDRRIGRGRLRGRGIKLNFDRRNFWVGRGNSSL
jgi:hypothetical protein